MDDRVGVIEYFAKEPQYYNHSELSVVNQWAVEAGCPTVPFPHTRRLPEDNGERFFGAYAVTSKARMRQFGVDKATRRCLCPQCSGNPRDLAYVQPEDDNDTEEEAPQMPDGTRFADKPSARRPFRAPQVIPARPPTPPPLRIAPQPRQQLQQQQPHFYALQQMQMMQTMQWHQHMFAVAQQTQAAALTRLAGAHATPPGANDGEAGYAEL